jgi:hypothetical protein
MDRGLSDATARRRTSRRTIRVIKRDDGVISIPPTCGRITLEIFLLVLTTRAARRVPPTSLRAVFLWCGLPLLGLFQRRERVGFDPLEALHAQQQQSRSANGARYSVASAKFRGGGARLRARVIALPA